MPNRPDMQAQGDGVNDADGRPATACVVDHEVRRQLMAYVRGHRIEHRLHLRARIVWDCLIERHSAAEVAESLRVTGKTVRKWCQRFLAQGMAGLSDQPRSGTPVRFTLHSGAKYLQLPAPTRSSRLSRRHHVDVRPLDRDRRSTHCRSSDEPKKIRRILITVALKAAQGEDVAAQSGPRVQGKGQSGGKPVPGTAAGCRRAQCGREDRDSPSFGRIPPMSATSCRIAEARPWPTSSLTCSASSIRLWPMSRTSSRVPCECCVACAPRGWRATGGGRFPPPATVAAGIVAFRERGKRGRPRR